MKEKMSLYLTALADFSKEALRLMVTALVSYLLTEGVVNTLVVAIVGTRLTPEVTLIVVGAFITAIKSLDRSLHNVGVTTGSENLTKGIIRF